MPVISLGMDIRGLRQGADQARRSLSEISDLADRAKDALAGLGAGLTFAQIVKDAVGASSDEMGAAFVVQHSTPDGCAAASLQRGRAGFPAGRLSCNDFIAISNEFILNPFLFR